jgi:chromosomal replication initiation ATPase DnaA
MALILSQEAYYDMTDEIVSKMCDIPVQELYQSTRRREVSDARFMCMSILKNIFNPTLGKIGQRYGGRDHSTVINALEKTEIYKETLQSFSKRYNYCYQYVEAKVSESDR